MSASKNDRKLEAVDPDRERFHWIVIFNEGDGKVYTYQHRSIPYMTGVIKKFEAEHHRWPHRMWVIVGDKMQEVAVE